MHPDICDTISAMVYESKLKAAPGTERLAIRGVNNPLIQKEHGIIFVPVEHEGNSQASEEEVAIIDGIYKSLLGASFSGKSRKEDRSISSNDILIVSPYNFQVSQLTDKLGDDARVGSVDRFQGQEAPVVIISMAASENSSRGAEFLFSKNRMNVAISRAQALVILVANPRLASTYTSNVDTMALINLFARLTDDN